MIDFTYERQRHAGFVGRADLLARLDRQLIEDTAQRWVVMTGGPGMGKSAVLAAWLTRREAAGEIVPHHFIRRGWSNWDDPEALADSLVAQIETWVLDLGEPEVDPRPAPAARLSAALQRVSEVALVPRGERLVLLIDGLDEYDPRPGLPPGDPLAAFLPYVLPPGVSVLCASRPRHPYIDQLATRGVLVPIDLDDATSFADDNAATVRAFWEQAATLEGHTNRVSAFAVTPDGRHVVSASEDRTLKIWDLATYTCRITHRGDAGYLAVAVTATTVIAGDEVGGVWFLDVPRSLASLIEAPSARDPSTTPTISRVAAPVPAADPSPNVDIGIVTIREDEFRAVLAAFPEKLGTVQGSRRAYTLRHADAGGDEHYRIAVLRLIEQGQGEAQDAARDLLDDLRPRLVLVVGIAGGRPSSGVQLGDVVVSTRIHDFTVEARKAGEPPTYAVTGGPVDKALAAAVANLPAREDDLGDWTAGLPAQPPVSWTQDGQLYGSPDWQRELRDMLERHHGPRATSRAPMYAAGPIASSDRLVEDPELLIPWLQTARNLLAIEMESGGVYRAAHERCPMLAIRGISDIVAVRDGCVSGRVSSRISPRGDGIPDRACHRRDSLPRAAGPTRLAGSDRSAGRGRRRTGWPGPSITRPRRRGGRGLDVTVERAGHARFVGAPRSWRGSISP